LEYDNIILYNFTSADEERFREITRGVSVEDLRAEELRYARARDKSDKSLEIYKFHVNALYVAITRAVENLYLIEANPGQRLFEVLGLVEYALVYQDHNRMHALAQRGFRPAHQPDKGIKLLNQKYFLPYELKKPEAMLRLVDQYGVDFRNPFNQTPLMIAARLGNDDQVARLVAMGADTGLINSVGFNAFHIALEQACSDTHYAARKLA